MDISIRERRYNVDMDKKREKSDQRGILSLILAFIVFAGTMFYFQVDLRGYVESHPQIRKFIETSANYAASLWNYFLWVGNFLWYDIMVDLIWNNIVSLDEKVRAIWSGKS